MFGKGGCPIRFAEDSEVVDLSGDDGGDFQEFIWRASEAGAPSLRAYRIADVLNRYQLLHIDRLRVSGDALLEIVRNDFDEPLEKPDFDAALAELEAIEMPLLEAGIETGDSFRIRTRNGASSHEDAPPEKE